ncbi:MAG: alpha/beta hydrolase [Ignavibacteriae bacterium]|nr:alpha/beta hydrolase [Ignavibacteriota bacterium]
MTRILLALFILLLSIAHSVQAQSVGTEKWVDYVSGEYEIISNITYATANNTALKLDVYVPRNRPAPLPTLILFHGGGWVAGMKEQNVFQLLPYLSMGWAVVNVEYRLANNSLAPAAVEDCRCALRWVASRAKQFNFDATKIVLTGGSAGGHLALITGMLPENSPFDRQCPTNDSIRWTSGTEPRVSVAAIVNWFGITDVADLLDGPNAKHYAIEWLGSKSNRKELAEAVSPLTYVRSGLPPVFTIHGDEDNLVPYSHAERLHKALDKAGVPNKLMTVRGGKHGGFNRETLISTFVAIREFLRANNILSKE